MLVAVVAPAIAIGFIGFSYRAVYLYREYGNGWAQHWFPAGSGGDRWWRSWFR